MSKKTRSLFRWKRRQETIQDNGPADDAPSPDVSVGETRQHNRFLASLKAGLRKTRQSLGGGMGALMTGRQRIDDDVLDTLEELLIGADLGVHAATDMVDQLRKKAQRETPENIDVLKTWLKAQLLDVFRAIPRDPWQIDTRPMVVLTVGVNGVGKTTTIGKMAQFWKNQGKSVLLCAADTFRAAAGEQLEIWAERTDVPLHRIAQAKDPAAVVFDALQRAKSDGTNVVLIDTAGRLHNNPNLMNELAKIKRVVAKVIDGAPHHIVLILDAVTGQNGLQQAREFVSKIGVTDLVLAKLDGTAKGGVAVAIAKELGLPIRFLGVGEKAADLVEFEAESFCDALLG